MWFIYLLFFSCSEMSDSFATPWTAAWQSSPFFTISWSLLKLMSIESVMPSDHLILCCSLLFLPSIFLSIRVFSNESVLCISIGAQLQHQSFQWIFRTDWMQSQKQQNDLCLFLRQTFQYHGNPSLCPRWSCMDVRVGLWSKLSTEELMLLNCGVGEDSWESLGLQGDPTSPFWRRSALGVHWKDWC